MGANKKLYGWYEAGKIWLPIKVSLGGSVIIDGVPDHGVDHQNGGSDEIIVTGLSGLLGDSQTPLPHNASHESDGSDEIDVTGLVGLPDDIPQNLIAFWDLDNGAIPTGWSLYEAGGWSEDKCINGTVSESSFQAGYDGSKAFDDSLITYWASVNSAPPHWIKYDFNVGVSWVIEKVTMQSNAVGSGPEDYIIAGSNDDIEWTNLASGTFLNNVLAQEVTFENITAYRYIRLYFSTSYSGGGTIHIAEISMNIKTLPLIIKD